MLFHMQLKMDTKGYLTKKEAAIYCAVSVKTLSRWSQLGLPSIQVTPGGRVLIHIKDLEDFLHTKRVVTKVPLDTLVESTLRELSR